jgi:Ca-activated chloride channel family protein
LTSVTNYFHRVARYTVNLIPYTVEIMYTFSHPWLFLLIILPLILRAVLPPYSVKRKAIRVPWFRRTADLLGTEPAEGAVIQEKKVSLRVFHFLLWVLIVLAMAGPQYLEAPLSRVIPTRDLMLLVDLSGSMDTRDFTDSSGEKINRLAAVKEVLDDFLTRREGDRVGLIVFGNAPFVQVPFTQDLDACRLLLEETAVRMAGPRTAFGDAIGLGITLFEESQVKNRLLIALTDGNDTGSKVPPEEAAKIASDNGIKIYVVGVGDPAATGEEELDEEALLAVAEETGGRYFHAEDRKELQEIYEALDRIETREVESETYRPRRDLFYWPLGLFFVLTLLKESIKVAKWKS